ncbi:HAD family acid phosphatase [Endozoicomonadaceae bacterium StTr2]
MSPLYKLSTRILSLLLLITVFPVSSLERNQQDLNNELLMAIAWHQQAEEFKALSWQTFNIAIDLFDEKQAKAAPGTKIAIIADIDDTLAESSAHFGGLLERNEAMSMARSITWWKDEQVTAMPGAREFLEHVNRNGGRIFYLSNRPEAVRAATLSNLKKLGFPQLESEQVLLSATGIENKYPRIKKVLNQGYQIAVMLGDKLSDFAINEMERPADWQQYVDQHQSLFGDLLLVQANAMYGSWDRAIQGKFTSSAEQEAVARRQELQTMALPALPDAANDPSASGHIQHLIWKQRSGEYRAIGYQVYQRAWLQYQRLKAEVKHPAISIDIDDTLIENSPYIVATSLKGVEPALNTFCLWGKSGYPMPIPGAISFLNRISMSGGSIFYISAHPNTTPQGSEINDQRDHRAAMMRQAGFPQVDNTHLIMFDDLCSKPGATRPACYAKQEKRAWLERGQYTGKPEQLVLLIGDNLPDIDLLPEHINNPDTVEAKAIIAQLGRTRFLIPAPNYPPGWIKRMDQRLAAAYSGNGEKLTLEQRHELRLAAIRKWNPAPSPQQASN